MVASHGNLSHLDVSASFTVAQFVWISKVDSDYGVGTRCPQLSPPRRHRHVTCTSSATMQYSCLYFHAHGSVFVLARRGGCLCKLYSAQETRKDGGFHHKATVHLYCKGRQKEKATHKASRSLCSAGRIKSEGKSQELQGTSVTKDQAISF